MQTTTLAEPNFYFKHGYVEWMLGKKYLASNIYYKNKNTQFHILLIFCTLRQTLLSQRTRVYLYSNGRLHSLCPCVTVFRVQLFYLFWKLKRNFARIIIMKCPSNLLELSNFYFCAQFLDFKVIWRTFTATISRKLRFPLICKSYVSLLFLHICH